MPGSIKTYTPNFKMIIPEFNVATWHDYIEENFRNIDALFHNLFGINGFSGMWKTNSQYTNGQVLFVGEDDGSQYEGRLVKVIQDTNTGGFATFSEAIRRYPNHYEMYADASSAEIFATLAQDWATKTGSTIKTPTGEDTGEYSAKHYSQLAAQHEEACEMYRNLAKTDSDLAKEAENEAANQAQLATIQATNAATSAINAKTSETNAKTSENNAKLYADQAQLLTEGSLNETQIANCITEIPQDIKLEFNTTTKTLTLKAGSKLYIPNGSGIFNKITINSDKTLTNAFVNQYNAIFVCWDSANNVLRQTPTVSSGTSDQFTIANRIWYDITANKIKYYQNSGTTVTSDSLSLPICIMQNADSSGGFTKIQQTFNGFGYIGSTIFALPGVKGLIPNGRNEDGTLKSIDLVNPAVRTLNVSGTFNRKLAISTTGIGAYIYAYDAVKNAIYRADTRAYYSSDRLIVGDVSYTNGVITSFQPKTAFHAVDYNDFAPVKEAIPTKQDIATAVNYDNITNCITEIPQDIKLELANGILTLKAGSKIYVPNGKNNDNSLRFDELVIDSDIEYNASAFTGRRTVCLYYNKTSLVTQYTETECFGGTSSPTSKQYMLWYDTTNNLLKSTTDTGSTWIAGNSLPICIINGSTSIDQVFNGFGYIGSTVFALPGVKGLKPNGRNTDETLKNISFTISSVITSNLHANYEDVYIRDVSFGWSYDYDEDRNVVHLSSDKNQIRDYAYLGKYKIVNGKISYFNPRTPFHAVDYNDAVKYSDFATTKATTTSSASNKKPAVVVQNYRNGTNWYRVWSDGWIEQGGTDQMGENAPITLLKPFSNTDYTVLTANGTHNTINYKKTSTSVITFDFPNSNTGEFCWYACGY